MNHITLLGRLTKDPEVRYMPSGVCMAGFTLAVNRPKQKDKEQEADFIPVIFFGKTAETVGNYVHKGQRLLVDGRLQIRTYEDKNGQKRWATEVIGNNMEFIEKRENGGGNGGFSGMGTQEPFSQFDEDIPF